MTDSQGRTSTRLRLAVAALAALALTFGVAACGDDEDSDATTSTTAASTTEETTSAATSDPDADAESVSVTTTNDGDGFTWDVDPIPNAGTKTVTFNNESDELHVMIFARLSEGVTLEEATEAQGEKGTTTDIIKGGDAKPGETVEFEVVEDITPGNYVMLCPLAGPNGPHAQLGQLKEFTIE